MTARRASDMQIERLTFTWTPLDELAEPPTGLDPATEIAQLRTAVEHFAGAPRHHRDGQGRADGALRRGRRRGVRDPAPTSQRSNTKLVKVAAELVDRHSATAGNQSRDGADPNIAALVELDLDLNNEPRSFLQRRRPPSLRNRLRRW